jgi:capsular exopolysaccharide synthesis family protein
MVLRRRWWTVLLCAVIAGGAAFGISAAQTKEYSATASLLFNSQSAAQQASGITAVSNSDPTGQRATNLALVQHNRTVSQVVARNLGHGLTTDQVDAAVTAAQQGVANVVSVTGTWTNPRRAADIANNYAATFVQQQRKQDEATVENAVSLVQQQYDALEPLARRGVQGATLLDHLESLKILRSLQTNEQVIGAATAPSAPSSPRTSRNVLLGVVLGLFIGLALVFRLDRTDERFRNSNEVEEELGLTVLAAIPHGDSRRMRASLTGPIESFRMLRAHLRYFNVDRPLRRVLVTSSQPGEGKTTVASGLAIAAAQSGAKTLLIEADLRRPVLSSAFSLGPSVGLTGALVSPDDLGDAIQSVSVAEEVPDPDASPQTEQPVRRELHVLTAGATPPNPAELLESQAMASLLEWAGENYELVVLDTAPLLPVSDSIPVMRLVEGVILVTRLGLTTRTAGTRVLNQLESLQAPVLGLVINDVRSRTRDGYGYGYGPNTAATGVGRASLPPAALVPPRSPGAVSYGSPNASAVHADLQGDGSLPNAQGSPPADQLVTNGAVTGQLADDRPAEDDVRAQVTAALASGRRNLRRRLSGRTDR